MAAWIGLNSGLPGSAPLPAPTPINMICGQTVTMAAIESWLFEVETNFASKNQGIATINGTNPTLSTITGITQNPTNYASDAGATHRAFSTASYLAPSALVFSDLYGRPDVTNSSGWHYGLQGTAAAGAPTNGYAWYSNDWDFWRARSTADLYTTSTTQIPSPPGVPATSTLEVRIGATNVTWWLNGTTVAIESRTVTYSIQSGGGSLSTGATLPANSTVTYTAPATPGTAVIRATFSDGQQASVTVNYVNLPNITTTTLAGGTLNAAYSQPVVVSGGIGALTYQALSALPPGLTLNPTTGVVSGTPTTQGLYSFTVQVCDSATPTVNCDTQAIQLRIAMPVSIINTSLSPGNGTVGIAYTAGVNTSGGINPLNFTLSAGSLPGGLSIAASTGVISGTPTTAGTFNFTIQVADSAGVPTTDTQAYSVVIYAPLAVTPAENITTGCVTVRAFTPQQFAVTGGSGDLTWSAAVGSVSDSGLYTPPSGGVSGDVITITDNVTGLSEQVSICLESAPGICIEPVIAESSVVIEECCESKVQCGDRLNLRMPGLKVTIPSEHAAGVPPAWNRLLGAQRNGEYCQLTAIVSPAGGFGNTIPAGEDGWFDWVIDTSAVAAVNDIALGWSGSDTDATVGTIDYALVLTGSKIPEIRQQGSVIWTGTSALVTGDAIRFGFIGDVLTLLINGTAQAIGTIAQPCGPVGLDVSINNQGITLGGEVSGVTYTIITPGSPAQIGSILGSDYIAPQNANAGEIIIQGTLNGTRIWQTRVRVVRPTPRHVDVNEFSSGSGELWALSQNLGASRDAAGNPRTITLAADGTPDAITHPGAVWVGKLDEFEVKINTETGEFTNDGNTYQKYIEKESLELTGNMFKVKNLNIMSKLLPNSSVISLPNGNYRLGFGGQDCYENISFVVIKPSGKCGAGTFEVLHIPNASALGSTLTQVYNRKGRGMVEVKITGYHDDTLPKGQQLAYIDTVINCNGRPTCAD